uniref:HSF-type DNA-binding domain-containing protein n=1 Tax=Tetraodon nigroviridis TaxID=99883 RepID=H3CH06_TETNG
MEFSQSANIFPAKRWRLTNDRKVGAVTWNHQGGDGIIINKRLIEKTFLSSNGFKATHFLGFVSYLSFYGFKRSQGFIRDNAHHYFHPNFQRDQPELLPPSAR